MIPATAESVSAGLLGDADVCILVNVAAKALKDDFVKALDSFVRSGKGLFITTGENVVPKDYNATFGELLPTPLVDSAPYKPPYESPLFPDIASVDAQSFLSVLKEKGRNPLEKLNVAFAVKMTPVVDPLAAESRKDGARALLRFNDGQPFLLSKSVGGGEVLFLTSSVDRSWNAMEQTHAYLPFLSGCLSHLVQRSDRSSNRIAGEQLRWSPPDSSREYFVIHPDGERVGLPKIKGEQIIDLPKAGVYQIVASNEQVGERFAVVPDLRESESLESISDDQIDDQLGFKPIHLHTGFDGAALTGTERSRKEWTIYLLVALLIFALGESFWAWYCGKAW